MIARLARVFVEFQVSIGLIKEEDANIYQYGYTVMVEMALSIVISICLGVWLGQVRDILFFLCMFLPLRSYCGGYHADKAWKCMLLSNAAAIGGGSGKMGRIISGSAVDKKPCGCCM